MRAGLMRTEIDVPARRRQEQVDIGRQGPGDRCRSETRAVASVVEERGHGAPGDDVGQRVHQQSGIRD